NYFPNSLNKGGCPFTASAEKGGFVHVPEAVAGRKVRERSESFKDFYSQAALFLHSMAPPERSHIVKALQFELGKVLRKEIRQRTVEVLGRIDGALAADVAGGLGLGAPRKAEAPRPPTGRTVDKSPALSMLGPTQMEVIAKAGLGGKKVAVLVDK